MSVTTDWITAIGSIVAPVAIFAAGYLVARGEGAKQRKIDVLVKVSEWSQKCLYLHEDVTLMRHQRDAIGTTRQDAGKPPEKLSYSEAQRVEINAIDTVLRDRFRSLQHLAVEGNTIKMIASVAFGSKTAGALSGHIEKLLKAVEREGPNDVIELHHRIEIIIRDLGGLLVRRV